METEKVTENQVPINTVSDKFVGPTGAVLRQNFSHIAPSDAAVNDVSGRSATGNGQGKVGKQIQPFGQRAPLGGQTRSTGKRSVPLNRHEVTDDGAGIDTSKLNLIPNRTGAVTNQSNVLGVRGGEDSNRLKSNTAAGADVKDNALSGKSSFPCCAMRLCHWLRANNFDI